MSTTTNTTTVLAGVGAAAFLLACSGTPICETRINDPECGLTVTKADNSKLFIYPDSTKKIQVMIKGRLDNEEVQVELVSMSAPAAAAPRRVYTLAGTTQFPAGLIYNIEIKTTDLNGLDPGDYALRFQGKTGRSPAILPNVSLRKRLAYKPPTAIAYPFAEDAQPIVEQLGFVGNSVLCFSSGTDTSGTVPLKKIRVYSYGVPAGSLDELPGKGYFANFFPKETLAAFSKSDVYLLTPLLTNLPLRRCAGAMPASVADCPLVDKDSKVAIEANKALVVTADGGRVARADPSGSLWQAATQAPLKWEALMTTAMVAKAGTVKMASGDLNSDGKEDLVAIWREGGQQQVRVFLGADAGFGEDQAWSKMLQDGLGSKLVTALAVGDVDADGSADVVVGAGLELAIVQNQQDRFVMAWMQKLDPSSEITGIAAVAVGRLTGDDRSQSLDIVAAGNTPYDGAVPPAVPMSKLYLHALRPQ